MFGRFGFGQVMVRIVVDILDEDAAVLGDGLDLQGACFAALRDGNVQSGGERGFLVFCFWIFIVGEFLAVGRCDGIFWCNLDVATLGSTGVDGSFGLGTTGLTICWKARGVRIVIIVVKCAIIVFVGIFIYVV